MRNGIKYCIMDPTGNITALVESEVAVENQPSTAATIMERHPEVEQVGFVRFYDSIDGDGVSGELRMAGGEFCGNATMSAAALYLLRRGSFGGCEPETESCEVSDDNSDSFDGLGFWRYKPSGKKVVLRVSGAKEPVAVYLRRPWDDDFHADVVMPPAISIEERELSFGDFSGVATVVFMEGISHIVIDEKSKLFSLWGRRELAEEAVRAWCKELSADGLGLMFIYENGEGLNLRPLVYVPASDTLFWEKSCASGTAAAGLYFSEKKEYPVCPTFMEPGGVLSAYGEHENPVAILMGQVELRSEHTM